MTGLITLICNPVSYRMLIKFSFFLCCLRPRNSPNCNLYIQLDNIVQWTFVHHIFQPIRLLGDKTFKQVIILGVQQEAQKRVGPTLGARKKLASSVRQSSQGNVSPFGCFKWSIYIQTLGVLGLEFMTWAGEKNETCMAWLPLRTCNAKHFASTTNKQSNYQQRLSKTKQNMLQ